MGMLTESKHWEAANSLLRFHQEQAKKLEAARFYFMAAVALGAALETALLVFLLVEWDETRGEVELPNKLTLEDLICAAKQIDVLNSVKYDSCTKTHSVEKVIHEIQWMRNNLHPTRALRQSFDPKLFDRDRYQSAVMDNLLRNI
jgi:seryl-tRNA synthetase